MLLLNIRVDHSVGQISQNEKLLVFAKCFRAQHHIDRLLESSNRIPNVELEFNKRTRVFIF